MDCIGAQSLNGEVSTGAVGISTDYSDFPPQGHEIGTLTWDKGFANTNYMTVCGAGSSVNNFSAELLAVVISQGASTALVGVRVDGPRNGVETISCFGLQ